MNALKEALASRKFVLTLSGVVFVILNRALHLNIEEEAVTKVVSLIAAYVVGQGFVDGMSAHGADKTNAEIEASKPDPK